MAMKFLRKDANDWWKNAYKLTDNSTDTQCYFKYRLRRINALKKVYGEEWENYIWRILDIDDIGAFEWIS